VMSVAGVGERKQGVFHVLKRIDAVVVSTFLRAVRQRPWPGRLSSAAAETRS
jgi:hypothetical protein